MADIKSLTVNSTEYNFKDEEARNALITKANVNSPDFTGVPTAPTAATGTNTTQIATTAFVKTALENIVVVTDAMVFKGTLGTGGTITSLPDNHTKGWTYKVITAGTYAGQVCEIGDMIICTTNGKSENNDHWAVVQSNLDGAVIGPASSTANHVAVYDSTTGKVIKDGGHTLGSDVPSFTSTDSGKFLMVNSSGEIVANTMTAWAGGSY